MLSRNFKLGLVLVMTAALVVLFVTQLDNGLPGLGRASNRLTPEEIDWIRETGAMILRSYVEERDSEELVYSALEGMIKSLDDYCVFYGPEEEKEFDEQAKGRYAGVGLAFAADEEEPVVLYPVPGSPAERAGLLPGDRLLKINGLSLEDRGQAEVADLLRGDPGDACLLTFERPATGERRTVDIAHGMIVEPTVFGERIVDRTSGIAALRIARFHKETRNSLELAVSRLKDEGARALVIDLRFNGGGLLEETLDAANLFVGEGVLLTTRGRHPDSNRTFKASPSLLRFPDIPLVILVNHATASAAEVFAGTLQDHKRAVLVGTRTFGKGVVQSAIRRSFGKEVVIKLTTARYYTPLGRCIEKTLGGAGDGRGGLEPDFPVPLEAAETRRICRYLSEREIPAVYLKAALGPRASELIDDVQFEQAVRRLEGETIEASTPAGKRPSGG